MDEANPKSAGKRASKKTSPAKAKSPAIGAPAPRTAPVEVGFHVPAADPQTSASKPAPENGKTAASRISPEERHRLIAEAAYFRASERGFSGEAEVEDWLAAEAEIDSKLLGDS